MSTIECYNCSWKGEPTDFPDPDSESVCPECRDEIFINLIDGLVLFKEARDALGQAQTDTKRLDWLESLYKKAAAETNSTRVVLRDSSTGRGFRLHSCKPEEWKPNCLLVREAIDYHMTQFAEDSGPLTWPEAVSDGLTLPCGICKTVPRFDFLVDDETWALVAPKEHRLGVICLPCFEGLATNASIEHDYLINVQFIGSDRTWMLRTTQVHIWANYKPQDRRGTKS